MAGEALYYPIANIALLLVLTSLPALWDVPKQWGLEERHLLVGQSGGVCDILQKHLVSIDSHRAADLKSVGRTAGQQVKKRSLAWSTEKKNKKKQRKMKKKEA